MTVKYVAYLLNDQRAVKTFSEQQVGQAVAYLLGRPPAEVGILEFAADGTVSVVDAIVDTTVVDEPTPTVEPVVEPTPIIVEPEPIAVTESTPEPAVVTHEPTLAEEPTPVIEPVVEPIIDTPAPVLDPTADATV